MSVEVRYFAGAAEAAGTARQDVEVTEGQSVAAVLAGVSEGNDRLRQVIAVAAVLLDGAAVTDRSAVLGANARRLEVLPPFAGG